jgi:nucleoside phosphorylase
VLSGEKLVDDPDYKKSLLRSFPRAIAGEMECGGLSAAAFDRNVPFAMFKGICDFAENKDDKYQELAAQNAISVAVSMINARWAGR